MVLCCPARTSSAFLLYSWSAPLNTERKNVSAFLSGKSLNSLQQQCQQCCQHRERPRLKFAPTKVIFHICFLILKRQRNVLCIKILSNLARRPFQCWNCYHSWARTEQTVHRSCSCRVVSIQLERSAQLMLLSC